MEENVESKEESIKREDDPLKKDIIDIDSPKETRTLINTKSQDIAQYDKQGHSILILSDIKSTIY